MGVVVSTAYAISSAASTESWKPVIGWHNTVEVSTISATYEISTNPASNLANPATHSVWKSGSTSSGKLTVLFSDTDPMDYVALARHNFGTGAVVIDSIEALDPGGDEGDDGDWTEVHAGAILADDSPVLFRFNPTVCNGLRINYTPASTEPQAAVMYAGHLTVLPNGIPPGHRPINYARTAEAQASISEQGEFLGTIERTAGLSSNIEQKDLDKTWYETYMRDLALLGQRAYFFFAWSPLHSPLEVGYVHVTNNPQPSYNSDARVDIVFEIDGIAV